MSVVSPLRLAIAVLVLGFSQSCQHDGSSVAGAVQAGRELAAPVDIYQFYNAAVVALSDADRARISAEVKALKATEAFSDLQPGEGTIAVNGTTVVATVANVDDVVTYMSSVEAIYPTFGDLLRFLNLDPMNLGKDSFTDMAKGAVAATSTSSLALVDPGKSLPHSILDGALNVAKLFCGANAARQVLQRLPTGNGAAQDWKSKRRAAEEELKYWTVMNALEDQKNAYNSTTRPQSRPDLYAHPDSPDAATDADKQGGAGGGPAGGRKGAAEGRP